MFLIFGIIILLVKSLWDLAYFITDHYNTKLKKKNNVETTVNKFGEEMKDKINPNFYHLFLLLLSKYQKNQIHAKTLIEELGEALCIYSQIRELIFFTTESKRKNYKQQ